MLVCLDACALQAVEVCAITADVLPPRRQEGRSREERAGRGDDNTGRLAAKMETCLTQCLGRAASGWERVVAIVSGASCLWRKMGGEGLPGTEQYGKCSGHLLLTAASLRRATFCQQASVFFLFLL